jgi:Kef-type K+ transport system membrane component KefB
VERFEELVFLIFFTVAGTHFDPAVFASHLTLIMVYFGARILGKLAGAAVGAGLAGAPPQVTRWLGPALVPQAGVAVGLALAVSQEPAFAASGELIVNVMLGSTVLNEIVGPVAVRFSLERAGEVGERRNGTR